MYYTAHENARQTEVIFSFTCLLTY